MQVAFEQEAEVLAQHTVECCKHLDAGTAAAKRYRALAENGVRLIKSILHRFIAYLCSDVNSLSEVLIHAAAAAWQCTYMVINDAIRLHFYYENNVFLQYTQLDVVKLFLSANVYTAAPDQRLSELEWELRQAALLLKSTLLETLAEGQFASHMGKVCTL